MTEERKRIQIVLTARPPVRVYDDEWPVIATGEAEDYDGQYRQQATRTRAAVIRVRQHQDGRVLVYGTYDFSTQWQGERDLRCNAGELLPADNIDQASRSHHLVSAINRTADRLIERVGTAPEDDETVVRQSPHVAHEREALRLAGRCIKDAAAQCVSELPPEDL